MADNQKRPEPDLIDKTKGRLVEDPDKRAPTPSEKAVKDADDDLNEAEKQPS